MGFSGDTKNVKPKDFKIRVYGKELAKCGRNILEYVDEFELNLNNLYAIFEEIGNAWTGEKSQNFMNDINDMKQDCFDIGGALNLCGSVMVELGELYQDIEE